MKTLIQWFKEENFIQFEDIKQIKTVTSDSISSNYLLETSDNKYLIKIIKAEALVYLYQLNYENLIPFLDYQEKVIADVSKGKFQIPIPVPFKNQIYIPYNKFLIFITNYIDGHILNIDDYNELQINEVGKALALMHETNYKKYAPFLWKRKNYFLTRGLKKIYNSIDLRQLSYAAHFFFPADSLLLFMENCVSFAKSQSYKNRESSQKNIVFSHYDINPKNILWQNEKKYVILDWDTSTLIPRSLDYFETLLAFGHVLDKDTHQLNQKNIEAFKKGYKEIYQKKILLDYKDLYSHAMNEILWLNSNLQNQNLREFKNSLYYLKFIYDSREELLCV